MASSPTTDDWLPWTTHITEISTEQSEQRDDSTSLPRILVCTLLIIVTMVTIIGNLIVMLSFYAEKRLRTTFNYYIFNLAVTDFLVACSAMSFYTFDVLLGYWPFGEVLCGFWIFFDYGMTFASVFTLVAISLDRNWSVTWSIHYRTHNTKKKTILVIIAIWIAVLLVWLAPCIMDRVKWSEPSVCIWEPSRNPEFVMFIAVVGHHTPCLIMVVCYIRVFMTMHRRSKRVQPTDAPSSIKVVAKVETISTPRVTRGADKPTQRVFGNDLPTTSDSSGRLNHSQTNNTGSTSQQTLPIVRETSQDKDNRAFRLLTSIIVTYLICWVPFHIVFDVSSVRSDLIPVNLYTITFWLTYFNSTLNPLLYAFTSPEFRAAFKKVGTCQLKKI